MKVFTGILVLFCVFAALLAVGWRFTQTAITKQPEYILLAKNIIVPPPPDGIPDDFIADTLSSAGIHKNVSMLDKTLPKKIADAFAANPWVEHVQKVELYYPSGAKVDLEYRRPVAVVEVPQQGNCLVDRNGVVLPARTEHTAARSFIVITGIQTAPLGSAGTLWGDELVHTAAHLAGELSEEIERMKLACIIPALQQSATGTQVICRLKTQNKTEIIWGVSDSADKTKRKKLWDLTQQYRSLDNVPMKFKPIDLTNIK